MSKTRKVAAGFAAVGAALAVPGALHAQQASPETAREPVLASGDELVGASVTLRVDGMVCPFCAYGLEQRLGKISSIDAVLVHVSDGLVQIRTKEGQELTDEALREAVTKSGFALREIVRSEG